MTTVDDLHAFANDPALARLQELIGQGRTFNLFDALGATRQEVRHSHLLAYLLDPHQPHGLETRFLRHLLRTMLPENEVAVLSGDMLAQTRVHRERNHIDLLLELPSINTIVVIENKIDTSEHSDQLARYLRVAAQQYPGWTLRGVYLTPEGHLPSHSRYQPVSYAAVVAAVQAIQNELPPPLPDVEVVLRHYATTLRRSIVPDSDSELARLGRRLYREHQPAIEQMLAMREQRMDLLEQFCATLIAEQQGYLVADQTHRPGDYRYVRSYPPAWNTAMLRHAHGWTTSGLLLLIEFSIHHHLCALQLIVGRGRTDEAQTLRIRLNDIARQHQPPFNVQNDVLSSYFRLYYHEVLLSDSGWFEELSDTDLTTTVRTQWDTFLAHDLPAMNAILQRELGLDT